MGGVPFGSAMKTPWLLLLLSGLLLSAGCSTPDSVAKMEGRGTRRVYNATYDVVWNAAIGAASVNDMCILEADEVNGHISARRGMNTTTFGENISIWIHRISQDITQVEVVGRQDGPPVYPNGNPETRVLHSISSIIPI